MPGGAPILASCCACACCCCCICSCCWLTILRESSYSCCTMAPCCSLSSCSTANASSSRDASHLAALTGELCDSACLSHSKATLAHMCHLSAELEAQCTSKVCAADHSEVSCTGSRWLQQVRTSNCAQRAELSPCAVTCVSSDTLSDNRASSFSTWKGTQDPLSLITRHRLKILKSVM